jgi:hypothetical protein
MTEPLDADAIFVPGYKRPSTVDSLMQALFEV